MLLKWKRPFPPLNDQRVEPKAYFKLAIRNRKRREKEKRKKRKSLRDSGLSFTDPDLCHQEINGHKRDETSTKLSDN